MIMSNFFADWGWQVSEENNTLFTIYPRSLSRDGRRSSNRESGPQKAVTLVGLCKPLPTVTIKSEILVVYQKPKSEKGPSPCISMYRGILGENSGWELAVRMVLLN